MSVVFPLLVAAGLLLLGLIVGWITGKVSASRTRALQYWAAHPWRIFWLANAIAMGCLLLLAHYPVASLLVYIPCAALAGASAVQGLRLTWEESKSKAVIIVAAAALFMILWAISQRQRSEPQAAGDWAEVAVVLVWPFSSYVASVAASPKGKASSKPTDRVAEDHAQPSSPTPQRESAEIKLPSGRGPFE
jgi:hypothetical protein